jgi:hypothetical protein
LAHSRVRTDRQTSSFRNTLFFLEHRVTWTRPNKTRNVRITQY